MRRIAVFPSNPLHSSPRSPLSLTYSCEILRYWEYKLRGHRRERRHDDHELGYLIDTNLFLYGQLRVQAPNLADIKRIENLGGFSEAE
ncbi:hypothetical protein [Maribacter aestuarii]|uniref:hypothetical protein n=1 Tax=Maribacter aestuarii TaxID=1130723 RepID=UPI00248D1B0F|nr:hypothetical protein [Maribacter aestuarii]